MKKILALALIFTYVIPVYGAGKKYKEEIVNLAVEGATFNVRTKRTLVHGTLAGRYSVKNLFDKNKSTAWCTKYNKGYEDNTLSNGGLLTIIFQEPRYVKSISIRNGYQKSEKLYYANQRIKNLYIEKVIIGGRTYPFDNTATLKDSMAKQEVSLSEGWKQSINLFRTKELIFDITDIYKGTKYDDLCISELQVNFTNKIEYSPSTTWQELKRLIDTNRIRRDSGWSWDGLNKENYKMFNDLLYYVLTGNKEAYTYFATYKPQGTGDSEAMKVIYKPAINESLKFLRK